MTHISNPSAAALSTRLEALGLRVVDELRVAGRSGETVGVPAALHPETRARLMAQHHGGLYTHQARAIERGLKGDVCLATSTASGKSLVFMALADDALSRSPTTRVLALYPMKALIEDQHMKWRKHFAHTDVNVNFIHGGVPVQQRWALLESSRVVLMTPDIVHAWVLSSLRDPRMQRYLADLGLLILDEAHAYEGVFGTNAAYLFRRLEAAARPFRLVASTATVSDPGDFIRALTGREVDVVGPEAESSPQPTRHFVLCRPIADDTQQAPTRAARLLADLTARDGGCTLAFADSRKTVERVLRALDQVRDDEGAGSTDASGEVARRIATGTVLPYRSGYEDNDRREIQHALARREVRGVVATSALELGIDIGEIDVTVLLNVPPTIKAFRQRIGRAGRSGGANATALCVIVDERGALPAEAGALERYLQRPVEPSRLYLDNRFVMYGHALCAAREAQQARQYDRDAFETLPRPQLFNELVENELRPTRAVDDDLLRLKQEAQDDPHHTLPLRTAGEVELQVVTADADGRRIGYVTHSQALREAYPGAVYVHLGQPWRVQRWAWAQRQIVVVPMHQNRHARTEPVRTDLVFPNLKHGLLAVREGATGRVFEAICQVSARVHGFTWRPVPAARPERVNYGVGSAWSQRTLDRPFTTTCVAWTAQGVKAGVGAAEAIRTAYCARLGVHEQDLGVGTWQLSDRGGAPSPLTGVCIYDAIQGSLRLGQQLVELFDEVLVDAIAVATANEDLGLVEELATLVRGLGVLPPAVAIADTSSLIPTLGDESTTSPWLPMAPVGTRGLHTTPTGHRLALTIRGFRFTPRGPAYIVQRDGSTTTEAMLARDVALAPHPPVEWNPDTDEVRALAGPHLGPADAGVSSPA